MAITTASFALSQYTEITACISLLQVRYFEIAEKPARVTAGDITVQYDVQLLAEIRQMLKLLRGELLKYKSRAGAQMGIPGLNFDTTTELNDLSYAGWRPATDGSGLV